MVFYFYTFKVIYNNNFDLLWDICFQPLRGQLISAFEQPNFNLFNAKFTFLDFIVCNKLILKLQ